MILESLAGLLGSASVCTPGTDLFVGTMPDQPDLMVGLFEYAGAPPMEAFTDGGASLDRTSVQVMVRGGRNEYGAARALMVEVRDTLVAVANATADTSGVRILRVSELSGINFIGNDNDDRPRLTLALRAVVER